MYVSLKLAFVAAGLVCVACIAVTGYFLAADSTEVTEGLVLQAGESQVMAAIARINERMLYMMGACDFFGGYFTEDLGHLNISTPEQAVDSYNASFFNLSMQFIQSPGAPMGITMTFLYPPYSQPKKLYNTMQSLNDWEGHSAEPSDGNRLYTYTYTMPDGVQNLAWAVDMSGPAPRIVRESYNFSQRRYYIGLQGLDHFWDRIWPWIASDGTSYLYLTYQRAYEVHGVPVLVQSLGLVSDWYDLLAEGLPTDHSSQLIIVDGLGQLLASSLDSGQKLSCAYQPAGSPTFIDCDQVLANESPVQLIRDMYSMTALLGDDDTHLQGVHTINGTVYFYDVRRILQSGNLSLTAVWVWNRQSAMGTLLDTQLWILAVGCTLTALTSTLLAVLAICGLLAPLDRLVVDMRKVRSLDVEHCRSLSRRSCIAEVRRMQVEFGAMMNTIICFTKYVPKQVVRDLIANGEGLAQLGMKQYHVTILFLDIAGFQQICERLDSAVLSALMELFFAEMAAIVVRHAGTVDKYIGDTVMCLWGAPLACDEPQVRACCAALAMRYTVQYQILPQFADKGLEGLHVQVALHSGPALCGNVGGPDNSVFTATGDAVNTAARLVHLNQAFGSTILTSEAVQGEVGRVCVTRYLGTASVGPNVRLPVYTLEGLTDGAVTVVASRSPAAPLPPTAQPVDDCLGDLIRLDFVCPLLVLAGVKHYNQGVRCREAGAAAEAALEFRAAVHLLEQLGDEGPPNAAQPPPPPPGPSAAVGLRGHPLPEAGLKEGPLVPQPRVSRQWAVSALQRDCRKHIHELARLPAGGRPVDAP